MCNIDPKKVALCVQWAKDNGAIIDDAVQFNVSKSSGVMATLSDPSKVRDWTKPLISIPDKLLITHDLAATYFKRNPKLDSVKQQKNPNSLVQLYLCKLKFDTSKTDKRLLEDQSFFKPYLDILPLRLNQPYFWSPEIITTIRGTDLYIILRQTLQTLIQEWHSLLTTLEIEPPTADLDLVSKFKDMTGNVEPVTKAAESGVVEELLRRIQNDIKTLQKTETPIVWTSFVAYLWSYAIFTSRAFPRIVLDDKNVSNVNEAFLLPIVDFLNHRNGVRVNWKYDGDKRSVTFCSTGENLTGDNKAGQTVELFNNYGDRSNEELLLGYGFVEGVNNPFDVVRLTLKLDSSVILNAKRFNIALDEQNVPSDDTLQFMLSASRPLSTNLLQVFSLLCKLKSESVITTRATLEGTDKLNEILHVKLESVKTMLTHLNKANSGKSETAALKVYLNSQKIILQRSIEQLLQKQKKLLKQINPKEMLSFKTIFKLDKVFADAMLLTFGTINFEDMVTKNCINKALLLWLVRVSNKDVMSQKLGYVIPKYITDEFEKVSKSIVIEKEDVLEYMDLYKSMFPSLSEKIPDVFSEGNWGIRQFIVADTVLDRLAWIRKSNSEPIFFEKKEFMGKLE